MVAEELIQELRTVHRNFNWGYHGRTRQIRGRLKSAPQLQLFDPISAVCHSRTKLMLGEDRWIEAAQLIELSLIDAGDLTAAANNVMGAAAPLHTQALRRQLIECLPLQPESNIHLASLARLFTGYLPTVFKRIRWSARP